MNHFTDREFACKCCGQVKIDSEFLGMLNDARAIAGIPFIIDSGYRCLKHEAEVNGKGNHPTGKASDIRCEEGIIRLKMLMALLSVGFRRIGIGKTFIHADSCNDKPRSIWLY